MLSNEFFSLSEYTTINVGWGSAPNPTGGAYSALPDPLAGFKGAASWQEGMERRTRGGVKEGERGNGEGRGKGEVGG